MDGQPAWRFCDKCFGMFFNGDPDPNRKGICPAGDQHHAQGFVFYLPHNVPDTVGQPGWRFCDKCFGMFFDGNVRKGICPAGNAHHAQGFPFVLPHDVPDTVGQPGWRFCDKCLGMFLNTGQGICPAGDQHHAQGAFLFVLPHRPFPNPSITTQTPDGPSGRYIEVSGWGFEPDQTAQINYKVVVDSASESTDSKGGSQSIRIDSSGHFTDHISLNFIIPKNSDKRFNSAEVTVFDFGSGETMIETIR